MAQFDLPLPELETYSPEREEPDDFDAFWTSTLAEARSLARPTVFEEVDAALPEIVVEDVTFTGFGGHDIRGWLLRPRRAEGRLPVVVQYIGYSGGRGLPHQHTMLPSAGYAVLVMDTRGQGTGAWPGATVDPDGSGPHVHGRMSIGITDPTTYYYRRVFTDAARAVDAVREHPAIDPERVVIWGGSQGGGIALAAAGLSEGILSAFVDFPFLCHYRRALRLTDSMPYAELTAYMQSRRGEEDEVFRVLSYFDGVNFAARATAPALFQVALCDTVCPPSTVYAAYNHYAGPKDISVYPYNGHEGGGPVHQRLVLDRLRGLLG